MGWGLKLICGLIPYFFPLLAVVSLVISEYSSRVLAESGPLQYAYANLWVAGIIAVGKLGGMISAVLMNRYFSVPPPNGEADQIYDAEMRVAYTPFFSYVLLGGISTLLIPVSYELRSVDSVPRWACTALLFLGVFLFFLFSTLSKIGFSTLMQSLAARTAEHTGLVFGFMGTFVTMTDAAVLMTMSTLFAALDFKIALWIICSLFALHGIIERFFGPDLVLPRRKPSTFASEAAKPLL